MDFYASATYHLTSLTHCSGPQVHYYLGTWGKLHSRYAISIVDY